MRTGSQTFHLVKWRSNEINKILRGQKLWTVRIKWIKTKLTKCWFRTLPLHNTTVTAFKGVLSQPATLLLHGTLKQSLIICDKVGGRNILLEGRWLGSYSRHLCSLLRSHWEMHSDTANLCFFTRRQQSYCIPLCNPTLWSQWPTTVFTKLPLFALKLKRSLTSLSCASELCKRQMTLTVEVAQAGSGVYTPTFDAHTP